jgi:hypothetical protein
MHPTEPVAATIDGLGWLSGHWRGDHRGGRIEEWWSEADGGMLLGMFRWIQDGAPRFYEILSVEPDGAALVFRIKHFGPGMVGWEEQDGEVTLDLVSLTDAEAIFLKRGETRWMIYRRNPSTGELVAYFETPDEPHADAEDEFRYARR